MDTPLPDTDDLRRRALARLDKQINDEEELRRLTPDETARLVHELNVHRIELEMQNEELREAQLKLEESRAELYDLYHYAPVGYFTLTRRGVILRANAAGARMMGTSPDHLTGELFSVRILPDDRDVLYFHLSEVSKKREKQTCEVRLISADSRVVHARIETVPLIENDEVNGFRTVVADVTALKQAEDARRAGEAQYRLLVETLHEGVAVIDESGVVTFVNEGLCNMLGMEKDRLIGSQFNNLMHPNYRESQMEIVNALKSGITISREAVLTARDGSIAEVWLSCKARTDDDGGSNDVLCVCTDNRERKKSLELAAQTERYKAVADLAGGVAHNFNNLLQILSGNMELARMDLAAGNLDNLATELDSAREAARMGAETVRRLLTYSGIRHPGKSDRSAVFDLSRLVSHAIEMTKSWWRDIPHREGLSVSLSYEPGEDCFINGHEEMVFDMVINLLKNATDAVLTAGGGEIKVSTARQGDEVSLAVKDTGPGIPEQDKNRVFNPFFTTKAEIGAGLGLAVSRKHVDDHGGRITLESTEGHGAAFTVTLPAATGRMEGDETDQEDLSDETALQATVLVVDDDPMIVRIITSWLSREGFTTHGAGSGEEALEIFRDNPVDAVICDLGMPGMNGLQTSRAIRELCKEEGRPKPVFIILTGWVGHAVEEARTQQNGVDAVLEKPLNMPEMTATVRDMLK
jgi:PAS domain S-box-containing protein